MKKKLEIPTQQLNQISEVQRDCANAVFSISHSKNLKPKLNY